LQDEKAATSGNREPSSRTAAAFRALFRQVTAGGSFDINGHVSPVLNSQQR
jgi:hypothetical protein